jgi:hypothetical protein
MAAPLESFYGVALGIERLGRRRRNHTIRMRIQANKKACNSDELQAGCLEMVGRE